MTREKIEELSKRLTENIENGTIRRKTSSISTDYYDSQVEELCLYRYKRYLGSLRCVLDTQNMMKAIRSNNEKGKSPIKTLVKRRK